MASREARENTEKVFVGTRTMQLPAIYVYWRFADADVDMERREKSIHFVTKDQKNTFRC